MPLETLDLVDLRSNGCQRGFSSLQIPRASEGGPIRGIKLPVQFLLAGDLRNSLADRPRTSSWMNRSRSKASIPRALLWSIPSETSGEQQSWILIASTRIDAMPAVERHGGPGSLPGLGFRPAAGL